MSGLCPLGGGRMIGEVHVSQLDMLTAAVKRLEDKAAAVVVPAPADKKQRGELHRLLKPAYPCARFRLHCSALDFFNVPHRTNAPTCPPRRRGRVPSRGPGFCDLGRDTNMWCLLTIPPCVCTRALSYLGFCSATDSEPLVEAARTKLQAAGDASHGALRFIKVRHHEPRYSSRRSSS